MDSSGDFAELIDLGDGRRLYLESRGSGGPIVVLDSGYGHSGRVWDTDVLPGIWASPAEPRTTVLDGVAALTQVCLYDRPGTILPLDGALEFSRSDPVSMPRSASDMVDDLRVLLSAAGVPAPYVLVGHSLGGLLVRLFAVRYPDEVAGMVLVDAFSAELWLGLASALTPEHRAALEALEQEPRKALKAAYPEVELLDLDAIVAEEIAAVQANSLPAVPTVVLSRGRSLEGAVPRDAVPFDFPWEIIEHVSREAQARLIAGARHIIAAESRHMIQLDQPELVIEAIRQVVEAVRDRASWR